MISLPHDLVIHISTYLSVEDIIATSLTCNRLYKIIQQPVVWYFLLRKYFPLDSFHITSPQVRFRENYLVYYAPFKVMLAWKKGYYRGEKRDGVGIHLLYGGCIYHLTHLEMSDDPVTTLFLTTSIMFFISQQTATVRSWSYALLYSTRESIRQAPYLWELFKRII